MRLPSEAQCEGKLHILLDFPGFTSMELLLARNSNSRLGMLGTVAGLGHSVNTTVYTYVLNALHCWDNRVFEFA